MASSSSCLCIYARWGLRQRSSPPSPSPSCSRARGNRCFLSALVTFGVGGQILALATKPIIAFAWGGEAHAVRLKGLVAIGAKENEPLIFATVAHDAGA